MKVKAVGNPRVRRNESYWTQTKKLTFKAKFKQAVITDPYQVYQCFDLAEQQKETHTIIVDSATYLMDLFNSLYVQTVTENTQKAWNSYQQYWKNLIMIYVARSTKNVIFTAHTTSVLNEKEMAMEVKVPVKGALKDTGINIGAAV